VAEANIGEGDTVLDLGCGTGKNFPFIEERIGPGGRLIGLDYTPAMLEQAARRVDEGGWKNVELLEGRAEEVDRVVEGPVDGALSWCCLSIVPGWERAIAGTASLLRAGGRFTVYDMRTTKASGPLRWPLTRLVEWWVNHYGVGDVDVDYAVVRPWKATMAKYLTNVTYEEMGFGTLFKCSGERSAAEES
jgi:demethylmenaquinone methyltransferase/2-methoxy-6-polyprenyl-1,4-benzoquinol methylase